MSSYIILAVWLLTLPTIGTIGLILNGGSR